MVDMRTDVEPVDITRVWLEQGFWGKRVEINRKQTLPGQYEHLVKTGRIAALDPEYKPGDPDARHKFWDSDVAKWLEAACYSLTTHPDAELEKQVEGTVALLGRMQQEDGYLNSWFTMVYPERRWTNLRDDHELYCAGHLMEAAVAHFRATGKRHFLDMLCRCADCIGAVFGREEGQRRGYPGHEEIELALVKLHHATGEEKYLDLARYFVDERGQRPHYWEIEAGERGDDPNVPWGSHEYNQAHLPVRQQDRAMGHAVRAMYLYSGMVDIARADGDEELVQAGLRLWENVTMRQMYVTGSVGSSSHGERFTDDYDLPEETSYCETCAAIGLVFWARRLLDLHGDGRFADVMERALYNGVLSGISLSGDRYFYVNPLASAGNHHRSEWFGCACCPSNIARLLASIGQYMYSEGAEGWVHLYEAGTAELEIGGRKVGLAQRTDYPWEGVVDLQVNPESEGVFALNLRIPGWCRQATLRIGGEDVDLDGLVNRGYARLERNWKPGDRVRLTLNMPIEQVRANPAVRMANGKVALQKGPVVFCLEEVDNGVTPLARVELPAEAELQAEFREDLLGGIDVIRGQAAMIDAAGWEGALYRAKPAHTQICEITAVPYCVWDNRQAGQMLVWLRSG